MRKKGGVIAAFVNPTTDGRLEFFDKAFLLWNEQGVIEYFSPIAPAAEKLSGYEILTHEDAVAIPGLIDLHHIYHNMNSRPEAPRRSCRARKNIPFRKKPGFCDAAVAELQSLNFFQTCLAQGTTTVVAYLSSFAGAAEIAFAEAERSGIRAYLGLTLMDRNVPPALLTDTPTAEKAMLALITKHHKKNRGEFVVTPRFAISCTADLLKLCGDISRAHDTVCRRTSAKTRLRLKKP